ncbi:hypothetical protein E1301_Tti005812 [Triplophysa tibetana]|uniref:Uncharacterized protein n=1 Tax=Triplophysa tibetana TaxID=1572043 RepID=A0A5A9NI46_9TELE|nr:hypothetical protein E1301_Tti005812 [Triplophysa tibetana]
MNDSTRTRQLQHHHITSHHTRRHGDKLITEVSDLTLLLCVLSLRSCEAFGHRVDSRVGKKHVKINKTKPEQEMRIVLNKDNRDTANISKSCYKPSLTTNDEPKPATNKQRRHAGANAASLLAQSPSQAAQPLCGRYAHLNAAAQTACGKEQMSVCLKTLLMLHEKPVDRQNDYGN